MLPIASSCGGPSRSPGCAGGGMSRVIGLKIRTIFSSGTPLASRLSRNASEMTTTRDAERRVARSKRRAASSSGPSRSSPVLTAPSVTMSCTHCTHGVARRRLNPIAAASAGKHGETATSASHAGSSGAASPCDAAKLSSWRTRCRPLSRPIHSGSRRTGTPSRRSRYGRRRLPQTGSG
jgi:hypothetical protein